MPPQRVTYDGRLPAIAAARQVRPVKKLLSNVLSPLLIAALTGAVLLSA